MKKPVARPSSALWQRGDEVHGARAHLVRERVIGTWENGQLGGDAQLAQPPDEGLGASDPVVAEVRIPLARDVGRIAVVGADANLERYAPNGGQVEVTV